MKKNHTNPAPVKIEFPELKNSSMLQKRPQFDSQQVSLRAEELIKAASNRYRITVQVASRAKKRHRYETENTDDPMIKPVMRAILEMADELTQPEILGE
jgi:DNA-directed RNA polymerase subunit omega